MKTALMTAAYDQTLAHLRDWIRGQPHEKVSAQLNILLKEMRHDDPEARLRAHLASLGMLTAMQSVDDFVS
jgi:uncharacterized protein (DUF2267 family)